MSKFSLEIKLKAVNTYLNGADSMRNVAQEFEVGRTTLLRWVQKFDANGPGAFDKQPRKSYTNYSLEFKMDVINFIHDNRASIDEAISKYNIGSESTVRNWLYLYETQGIDALQPKIKGRPPMIEKPKIMNSEEKSESTLQVENEQLRMEVAYLKKLHALIQQKEKLQTKTKRK